MANVQFDEEQQYTSRRILGERVHPKMVTSLMKLGIVKNEKQAGHVLVAIATICFVITFYLYGNLLGFFGNTSEEYVPTAADLAL